MLSYHIGHSRTWDFTGAKPQIAPPLFDPREPPTKRIHPDHDERPHEVDNWQRVPPPGRRAERIVREVRSLEHPVRVSRKNTGAQKCVIQRVRNSAGVALSRSVGFCPGMPKKSRV